MTETELDTMLAESEEDNSISDPIDYIVQAINSYVLIDLSVPYGDCKPIYRSKA